MTAAFVVVPQWQGSGSSRAMRLVDGALAIRGDLPTASTTLVEVPLEAGDARGTPVHRLGTLLLVRERMLDVLRGLDAPAITIGGDCGVELAAIDHAVHQSPDVAVVWFDAHPDLNTPESSPSGAFSGMVLRTLTGEGPAELVPEAHLAPTRIVLAGVRDVEAAEQQFIDDNAITLEWELEPEKLVAAVRATGATSVYLHIDLDVLDPAELAGLGSPVPFGATVAQLIEAIRALRTAFAFAGAGVTEFAPASPEAADDDLPSILRIIGALTR
ncbi:MAG: arginase family protein [Microbacteriaceae bacterium]